MSELSQIIRETVEALAAVELIEESGLTITLNALRQCVEARHGLGEPFSEPRQYIKALIHELN